MSSTKFNIIIPPQDISCDPGLQEKLAAGDKNAFAWVYKNYCKKLFDYAMLLLHDEALSEDLVQDVFIKLWVNREKLSGIKQFNGYLFMMCRNSILSQITREKTTQLHIRQYAANIPTSVNAVEEMMDFRETKERILTSVKSLPKRQHEVFDLREHGLKRPVIAQVLGISELSVREHITRGLRFFKKVCQQ